METDTTTDATKSQASANEALLREIITAFGRADVEGILECFAEDCVYREMQRPDHRVEGREAFRASLREYFSNFDMSDSEITFVAVIANETHVCAEFETTARYVGPGSSPEGDIVTWTATLVDRVEGGKVKEEHVYVDARASS
jgi:ketosteroid isomerase-like protein